MRSNKTGTNSISGQ